MEIPTGTETPRGKYLIISADIKDNGQTLLRGNSTHRCVQCQLSRGNSHATRTEITQSQNPLSVGNNHCLQMNSK